MNGKTAWLLAEEHGYKDILEKLWCWSKNIEINLSSDLLLQMWMERPPDC
jgi:hypothetical protein